MKKDISRKAVEKAAGRMAGAMSRLHTMMPIGPTKVQVSEKEYKEKLRDASGQQLLEHIQNLGGEEAILAMLKGRQSNG